MRVVSLVPSWTETLVEAGVDVIGRTRFCIHPSAQVKGISVVGGTKDWNLDMIRKLAPDLILLDKEENPKFMAEQSPAAYMTSHIGGIEDVSGALAQFAIHMNNSELLKLSMRWAEIVKWRGLTRWTVGEGVPGLIEWGRQPVRPIRNIYYVIWRDPWMTVAKSTFIGSMLGLCGLGDYLRDFDEKYPKFSFADLDSPHTLFLFSSEPYPFLKKRGVVGPATASYAFVNGELFSWFGVRSLKFLEGLRSMSSKG